MQQPTNYRVALEDGFRKYSDRVMYVSPLPQSPEYEEVTYAEQRRRVVHLAAWLRSQGIRQGDKVAVGGDNSSRFLVVPWAAHYLGAVPVFINSTL
jgi:acyl-CoA synthetase (AMP-forming)/AMP-acid ligase II